MTRRSRLLFVLVAGALAFGATVPSSAAPFKEARIYIEYNSSGNDLGFHVFLDAEDWTRLRIVNPEGLTVFDVQGKGPYGELGLTELFFEGAEPSLAEFPLEELLERFPEGKYKFVGMTVDGTSLTSTATLSHAVPQGPPASADVDDDEVTIRWEPVTGSPPGFPRRRIEIAGYQVVVGSFQVTLAPSSTEVTLPPEFVESLGPGAHDFEVLAIDRTGNQTITEGTFETD